MQQRPFAAPRRRASNGAFHDYMRSVLAECSDRARLVRASRARWLHRLSCSPAVRISATNLQSDD